MTTYHLLAKPLHQTPDGKVTWETSCGLKVSLPPQRFKAGAVVQTPDKRAGEIIECAACYSGVEDEPARPSRQEAPDPLSARQGQPNGVIKDERGDDEVLGEEVDDYPG